MTEGDIADALLQADIRIGGAAIPASTRYNLLAKAALAAIPAMGDDVVRIYNNPDFFNAAFDYKYNGGALMNVAKAALAAIPAGGWDSENKSLDAAMESMGAHAPSPADAGMGSPVRYTDGTVSREYEEQPAGGVQSLNISDNRAQKETNIEHNSAPVEEMVEWLRKLARPASAFLPHIPVVLMSEIEAALNRRKP